MLLNYDPDDYEVKTTSHTCDYHKRNPQNRNWPGCTCGGSYSLVKKIKQDDTSKCAGFTPDAQSCKAKIGLRQVVFGSKHFYCSNHWLEAMYGEERFEHIRLHAEIREDAEWEARAKVGPYPPWSVI